jgi:hypothetical protein
MTGDGFVDGDDVRLFADRYGLELLPSFSRKLEGARQMKKLDSRRPN